MPLDVRDDYDGRAEAFREHKRSDIVARIESHRADKAAAAVAIQARSETEPICRLGACRLDATQLAEVARMLKDDALPRAEVVRIRDEMARERGPAPEPEQVVIDGVDAMVPTARRADEQAFWIPWAAENRDLLRTSVFKFVDATDFTQRLYRFVYVVVKPALLCMKVISDAPADDNGELLGQFCHRFACDVDFDFVYSDEPHAFSTANHHVHVLMESRFEGRMVISGCDWVPLHALLAHVDWPSRGESSQTRAVRAPPPPNDVEHPRFLEAKLPEYAEWCLEDTLVNFQATRTKATSTLIKIRVSAATRLRWRTMSTSRLSTTR